MLESDKLRDRMGCPFNKAMNLSVFVRYKTTMTANVPKASPKIVSKVLQRIPEINVRKPVIETITKAEPRSGL